ncbi:MAG: hypothetical protein NTX66_01020, partial [Candidatus Falkowbacteria bacterium]|nr:hypothetical protein [Candidatus Falkowbacteria bacterium]
MKKSLLIWSIIILTTAVILLAWGIYRFNFMNHSKPIQTEIITDPKNASYEINGQLITFKNGKSELDVADNLNTKIVTSYFGNEAKGDLNKDGQEDVAFILTQDTGGSGIFYYIAVALAKDKSYEGLNAILLGDRIAPQTTEFRDGQIIVNYADRKAGEAMTVSPSLGISKYFQVINNRLVGV